MMERESVIDGEARPPIGVLVSLRPSGLGAEVDAIGQVFTDRALHAIEVAGGRPTLIDISSSVSAGGCRC